MDFENRTEQKDPSRLHRFVWKFARIISIPLCWIKFNFHAKQEKINGPFLLVCNHNTDWDPILLARSFPELIYYVASEHLMRSGLGGKIVRKLMDPIPRQKGGSASSTVMSVLRRLKKGFNVGIFAEGNRSWDGVTGDILPTIGKLARTSGAALVTYRLEGGYFSSPRWAGKSIRRGRMDGRVVRIFSPEQLKAMKPDEIYACICEDLFEDAYARQRKNPIRYKGRNTAEHLERLIFICPACRRQGTLQSHGDTVRCWKCGCSFRYLPTGFLQGDGLPADNLRDWNEWQNEEIRHLCDGADDRPIFTDASIRTDEVRAASSVNLLGRGEMKLYRDRLELPGLSLSLQDITGLAVVGAQDLYVGTSDGRNFEIRSGLVCDMIKYVTACSHLTGINYGV